MRGALDGYGTSQMKGMPMVWNPTKEVAVARDAAEALNNAPMAVVFWITKDQKLGMATYGKTKELCAEAKQIGDVAWDAIMESMK